MDGVTGPAKESQNEEAVWERYGSQNSDDAFKVGFWSVLGIYVARIQEDFQWACTA